MEDSKTKIRINPRAFAADFVQGVSDDELAQRHNIGLAQLERLIELLVEKGFLTPEQVALNKERKTAASSETPPDATMRSAKRRPRTKSRALENRPPFEIIRARTLLLFGLGAFVSTLFFGSIISAVLPGDHCSKARTSVIFSVVFYVFFALLIRGLLSRAKLPPTSVVGPHPTWSVLGRHAILVFPLLIVSITAHYMFYFPLSYVSPKLVSWVVLDQSLELCTGDSALTNVLMFLIAVVIAPVLEEFVFRGLLLTRWTLKWNVRWAILLSSLAFGLGHGNILGTFFLGYVLCVAYIETKSLLVPISMHMANNGIVWFLSATSVFLPESDANMTLAQWRSYWWVALLAGLAITPWVILFVRRHFPSKDWRVPYLSLQESVESTEGLAKTA